ncbi:MAG: DUF1993 domain-containing protein [Myxococcales bacterium]|nr:DUF1993 domain-containing protein [Myxococcales bacterium]
MFHPSMVQFAKTLRQLDAWLDKAVSYAASKSFDVSVLLNARLAPDQYHFTRQVQAACDAAKFAAARLSGKEPPRNPDTETTVDELRARIASTLAFVESVTEADLAGAESRVVPLGWLPGKGLNGERYLFEMALPNFYFHVTTAYAILRHNGAPLGKADYIGSLPFLDC